jgi:hypothetical protein
MSLLLRRAGLESEIDPSGHYLTKADLTTSAPFPAIEVTPGARHWGAIGRKCLVQ